ncbi:MAG: hypothetical protein R2864_02245 [Syntrophotaleaceae bacterium]
MWRPWFAHVEKTCDNEVLAEETRQQIEILEQRVKERTIELEPNQALREEIEERSGAEGALRLVNQQLEEACAGRRPDRPRQSPQVRRVSGVLLETNAARASAAFDHHVRRRLFQAVQ